MLSMSVNPIKIYKTDKSALMFTCWNELLVRVDSDSSWFHCVDMVAPMKGKSLIWAGYVECFWNMLIAWEITWSQKQWRGEELDYFSFLKDISTRKIYIYIVLLCEPTINKHLSRKSEITRYSVLTVWCYFCWDSHSQRSLEDKSKILLVLVTKVCSMAVPDMG